jgi:hypothetical protein
MRQIGKLFVIMLMHHQNKKKEYWNEVTVNSKHGKTSLNVSRILVLWKNSYKIQ